MRNSSLQMKVVLGYYAISAIAISLSLFTLMELRLVERRVEGGEMVSGLLNNVLEMRRFEKNWLLYRQQADVDQILDYAALLQQTLNTSAIAALVGSGQIQQIQAMLTAYAHLVADEIRDHPSHLPMAELEHRLRALGKALVNEAEEIAERERFLIRSALEQHRAMLLLALVAVIVMITWLGRTLSRMVVTPLKQMEVSMAGIVAGDLSSLRIPSEDREIRSLTAAFNRVLEELALRHKHLLRSEKLAAMGTLLSGVAHELNNPLANILTSCQILQEELHGDEGDFQQELLTQIDLQVQRARNIVRSLLDFARDRPFYREAVGLAELLRDVVRFNKGNIPPTVSVKVEVPDDLYLSGDRQRLQQLFINLLVNAVEAIPGQGVVRLYARLPTQRLLQSDDPLAVSCRRLRDRPWVELQVQDSGSGVDPEHLERIFDPFFTTKPVGKGSGLGLAVVFEIVEEHEGAILVESQPGQGTLFRLCLPQADPDSVHAARLP
ncbi:MAG: HAMP domain-containing histidine kinase [Magnetococcales bacterium]|nr:HAMP domain-containing histidine kinase [Magnetococcales bacterium]